MTDPPATVEQLLAALLVERYAAPVREYHPPPVVRAAEALRLVWDAGGEREAG